MKKELLAVFTTAVLLAGCDSDDNDGPSGLTFDVGGHWEMSVEGDNGYESFANIVVGPDGRFMGTQGDPDMTMIGMQEGSIELDGSGVSAFGAFCSPAGSPATFDCGTMDITFAITDDDTMEGELEYTTSSGEEVTTDVKWVRLTELDKAIADADMIGTWTSINLQASTLTIDSTGAFSLAYSGSTSATGTTSKIADNIYGIDATVFLGSESTSASGLAFVDESGHLNVGVSAHINNMSILGDIYQKD